MPLSTLIFLDTNIFLDLYRVRGGDSNVGLLAHIDQHHEKIITTDQVEMEFKKNREFELKTAIDALKPLKLDAYPVPPILGDSQPSKMLKKHATDFNEQLKRIRSRLERALRDPVQHDYVYQIAQRLFTSDSACRLTREHEAKEEVRHRAERRYRLGYPPRKAADTSFGDAVNWEWIVRCAVDEKARIVIVSRDSDYGLSHKKDKSLNAWLRQEFRDRVGRRKIVLTDRLAVAYREAGITFSSKEAEEERDQLEEREEQERKAQEIQDVGGIAPSVQFGTLTISRAGGGEC
jgi:hypothetical protein